MRALVLCFVLAPITASAALLYVDTQNPSASDSNPGTSVAPWKTIQKAATTAIAGDTVTVKAGEYNEFVIPSNSGSAGNLITFTGERGINGEWLTIIDPSTAVTNGWVPAPEIGTGVYKLTNAPVFTHELTIAHKRVGAVYSLGDMATTIYLCYGAGTGLTNGSQLMALESNATVPIGGVANSFWDGIEALWTSTTNITYLRLRDGSDPNGLNIRIATNAGQLDNETVGSPAVKVIAKNYITYQNFLVRGAIGCFELLSTTNVTLQSNYMAHGISRVTMYNSSKQNYVLNNTIACDFYGSTNSGAFTGGGFTGGAPTNYAMRANLYLLGKQLMGHGTVFDNGVIIQNCGDSNVVSGNMFPAGIGNAVYVEKDVTSPPATQYTVISSNWISGQASAGIIPDNGESQTSIFGNFIGDCNANIRVNDLDRTGETNRVVYIYRNTSYEPLGVGDHVYLHYLGTDPQPYYAEIWYYWNSYSGGQYCFAPGVVHLNSGMSFLNNIISSGLYYAGLTFDFMRTNSASVRAFDYNYLAGSFSGTAAVWFGSNNFTNAAVAWNTGSVPSFTISMASPARDSALDVTQTFSLSGTNYPALPNTTIIKYGPKWDIGAFELQPPKAFISGARLSGARL